jgi:2'-5' RNA ligase
LRLFVALDVPDAVRQSLGALTAKLRAIYPDAKWVRLEGVHVTLKFIGEVPDAQVEQIRAALEAVEAHGPIELHFRGLGFFPSPQRPRVFWAGIEAGAELSRMAADIENRLERLGIPREKRDFHPHLTLARFESTRGVDRLRAAISEAGSADFGSVTADAFHLYQSVLKRSGAEYTRLATYALTANRES